MNIKTKTNKSNKINTIFKIINNKKGFAIELAILVIIIMSGVVLLITTLMSLQINRSNVSNKQIICEPIISSYGEDFYAVASKIIIQQNISQVIIKNPLNNKDYLISEETASDAIELYKNYLEEMFYAEPAENGSYDENGHTIEYTSTPSKKVLDNEEYLYQPIDDTPYFYSYKIINENDSTSLQLHLHIKTSYLGSYRIKDKKYSDDQISDENNGIVQAYRYTSKPILDVQITKGAAYTVGEEKDQKTYFQPIVSKWFYDSPMEIGTTNKKNYLPYLLHEEEIQEDNNNPDNSNTDNNQE